MCREEKGVVLGQLTGAEPVGPKSMEKRHLTTLDLVTERCTFIRGRNILSSRPDKGRGIIMEPNPKNVDCYFYYYSECRRGNQCKFRHEPSALGCEDMCSKWKDGSCTEQHCSLRHMELKKKRKEIPCYWEKQPGGCRKAHCAFLHQSKGPSAQGDMPNSPVTTGKEDESLSQEWKNVHSEAASSYEAGADSASADSTRRLSQSGAESYSSSPAPVEPIVVNFEEESDSESAPSWTPTKMPKEKDSLHVKTLEEIRLEKIQAESAAYWEGIAGGPMAWEAANPAANPSCSSPCAATPAPRKLNSGGSFKRSIIHSKNITKELDFKILTLEEIRKNRTRKLDIIQATTDQQTSSRSVLDPAQNGHVASSSGNLSRLGIVDLRTKLRNSLGSIDTPILSNPGEVWSAKRQYQDSSESNVPVKKPRIRLRRLSDLIENKSSVLGMHSELEMYAEAELQNIGDNIFHSIDQLLME